MSKEEGSRDPSMLPGWYHPATRMFWPNIPGSEGTPFQLSQTQHDMLIASNNLRIVSDTTQMSNVERFPSGIFVHPPVNQQHQMQQQQPSGAVPRQFVPRPFIQPPMPYRIHQMHQMQYIPPYGAAPQQMVQSMPIYYHQHQMQQFQSPGQFLKHQETQTDMKECKEQETQTGSTENNNEQQAPEIPISPRCVFDSQEVLQTTSMEEIKSGKIQKSSSIPEVTAGTPKVSSKQAGTSADTQGKTTEMVASPTCSAILSEKELPKTLSSTDSVGHDSTQVRNGSEQNEWVSSKQQPFTSSQTLEKLSVPAERKEKRLEYKPSHAQKTDEVSTECGQSDTDPHNKGAFKEQKQHPTQLVSETECGIVADASFQFPKKPAETSEISLAQKSVERQKVLTTQPKTLEKSKVESVVVSEPTTSEKEPSAASSSNQDTINRNISSLENKPRHAQKTDEVSTECGQSDTDPHNKKGTEATSNEEQKPHPTTPTQIVSVTESGIVADAPFQFPKKPAKSREISLAQKSVERQKVLTTQPKTLEKSKVESVVGSEPTTSEKEPSAASSSNQDSEKAAEKTVSQKKKPNEKKKSKKKAPKGTKVEKSGHADDDFEVPNYETQLADFNEKIREIAPEYFKFIFVLRHSFFAYQKDVPNISSFQTKVLNFWKNRLTVCIPYLRQTYHVDEWVSNRCQFYKNSGNFEKQQMAIFYKTVAESKSESASEDLIFLIDQQSSVSNLEFIEQEYFNSVMHFVPSWGDMDKHQPPITLSDLETIKIDIGDENRRMFMKSFNLQFAIRNGLFTNIADLGRMNNSAIIVWKLYKKFKTIGFDWSPEKTTELLTQRINDLLESPQSSSADQYVKLYQFLLPIRSSILDFNSFWFHTCLHNTEETSPEYVLNDDYSFMDSVFSYIDI